MTDTKPLASLGPSLLARKGAARPAMRPQYGSFAHAFQPEMPEMEDLGWNDMGDPQECAERPQAAEVLTLMPGSPSDEPPAQRERAPEPEVRHQQRKVAKAMLDRPTAFASLSNIKPRRSAFEQGRRAAFTLRLDAERHLRLRLAAASQGRSAQQLVTEALDRFLDNSPTLDGLVAELKRD